jgi:hypothetical protein
MTEPVPPPRRAGALGPALSAALVHEPAARPGGEQLDRMFAAVEHGGSLPPLGPPTPAGWAPPTPPGPAFPALSGRSPSTPPSGGPLSGGQWNEQKYPQRGLARRRVAGVAAAYSVSAVIVVAAVAFLLTSILKANDEPSGDAGPRDTGTQVATIPNVTVPGTQQTSATTTAQHDLLTPAGAREVVSALSEVMGGGKVSDLDIYEDHASATAPAAAVKNGFDTFEYRDGTATRRGPDTVDADRAVLDLGTVNWDALPALWERANNELGVEKPTSRYIVVDTDIIDGTPSLKLYLSDDYGGAYLSANLAGEVSELYPRE